MTITDTTNTTTLEAVRAELKTIRQTEGELRDRIYARERELRKRQYAYSGGEAVDRTAFHAELGEINELRRQHAIALAQENTAIDRLNALTDDSR
jgi:hypothetical protein